MATFEYRQAEEIRDAFAKHGVRHLFIGKSGAILLGFADVEQTVEVFVEKSEANGRALVAALRELEFELMRRNKPTSNAEEISFNSKMAHLTST